MQRAYTVEGLVLDDSFLRYCLDRKAPDKAFWDKQIKSHRDQKAIFEEARYTIILLHGKLDDNEVNLQVEEVKKLVFRKHSSVEPSGEPVSPQSMIPKQNGNHKPAKDVRKMYAIYSVAALVVLFFGSYLVQYTRSKPITSGPMPVESTYSTRMGERKRIQLPDGSAVVLNSNSSITLKGDFNRKERSIMLSGKAFFQVTKNPAKRFIVHSGAFSVTAIGTSFYVQGAGTGQDYKVDLLEGKVKLASNENHTGGVYAQQTILQAGEEAAWQPSKMSFNKTSCDSAALKKWVTGKLSFKNMPAEKVFNLLEQWYGVEITVTDKKWAESALTGDYDNKPLDHILKIICFSLSTGYSYSGNKVIIK